MCARPLACLRTKQPSLAAGSGSRASLCNRASAARRHSLMGLARRNASCHRPGAHSDNWVHFHAAQAGCPPPGLSKPGAPRGNIAKACRADRSGALLGINVVRRAHCPPYFVVAGERAPIPQVRATPTGALQRDSRLRSVWRATLLAGGRKRGPASGGGAAQHVCASSGASARSPNARRDTGGSKPAIAFVGYERNSPPTTQNRFEKGRRNARRWPHKSITV